MKNFEAYERVISVVGGNLLVFTADGHLKFIHIQETALSKMLKATSRMFTAAEKARDTSFGKKLYDEALNSLNFVYDLLDKEIGTISGESLLFYFDPEDGFCGTGRKATIKPLPIHWPYPWPLENAYIPGESLAHMFEKESVKREKVGVH